MKSAFNRFGGKNIAVVGLGVSNRPLVRLLLRHGLAVTGCDRTPREKLDAEVLELERMGCKLRLGEQYLEGLQADVVFRTPGLHPDHPELVRLRTQGAEITSEMALFFRVCPCRILAVTGSDGKTTTTTLISEILKAQGRKVWLGGNIGTPLLPQVPQMGPEDIAVVELSSFQLLDMESSPAVAVMTNLAPNHLDVHKDMEEYIRAKENIFRYQGPEDVLIVNGDNGLTDAMVGPGVTKKFSRNRRTNGLWESGGVIYRGEVPVLETGDIRIPGDHNIENYMAAILAVEGLAEDDTIRQVARSFGGVAHRIEFVREVDGARYYNDSIATSPSRTIAGLKSFREQVLLIAGGYDKHIPYDELGPFIRTHVKKLFLCGATAQKIRAAVENGQGPMPEIYDCGDLETALASAAREAVPGDVVLMSPASASFDRFKNFEVRGEFFKKLVWEL